MKGEAMHPHEYVFIPGEGLFERVVGRPEQEAYQDLNEAHAAGLLRGKKRQEAYLVLELGRTTRNELGLPEETEHVEVQHRWG